MPAKRAVIKTLSPGKPGQTAYYCWADGWLIRVSHGIFGDFATDVMAGLLYRSGIALFAPAFSERKKK
jgi:hypothetical protein